MKNRSIFALAGSIFALALALMVASCSSDSPTGSGGGGGGNMPPPNSVNISGSAFTPASLSVKVGTTVTWTNKDATTHTVTSDNGMFTASGNLSQNETYQFTFNTAGSFPYHCSIHPGMKATITVTP
jgi:plastocyanin